MARAPRRQNNRPQVPFSYKLVLNQWMFGLFGLPSTDGFYSWNGKKLPLIEAFKQKFQISESSAEGLDENNIHRFHTALTNQIEELTELPDALLLEYDQNIVRHTRRLNERRITRGDQPITWKYFQYLTLLFTEIYLDRYFRDPAALVANINIQIEKFNADKPEADKLPLLPIEEPASQLNKLAFWSATGSGKTLMMHANILQYQFHLEKRGRLRDLNRIILLTPNEGLSLQHLAEFQAAGIQADIFSKDARSLFAGTAVEIIDINKLRDEMGDKTVAVEAFEGNNLVLVDEGHRGASAGETGAWMRFRNALCEKGFSFEYSATFGQAVKGNGTLTALYGRCILFDYSYKFFYADGYGKDYQILNLDTATQSSHLDTYLVACALAFYQQQRLYRDHYPAFRPFNIAKPLWIFVGSKVTASLATSDASDIVQIVQFLHRLLANRSQTIAAIGSVLNQGLLSADGRNIFSGRFAYLNSLGQTPDQFYDDMLATAFNAPGGGALHIENIKGVAGEIALRVGDNPHFGVINVGDDAKLCKLCEQHKLNVGELEFASSLFQDINKPASNVNLLIGSKKFTEGWSSWRVSTMGLMNVGSTEGSQIIQLFGRGVRLKGYAETLKRSAKINLPEDIKRHRHIASLETLNIFGIRADYMAQFREFLEEEGLPTNDERIEFLLPTIRNLGQKKLKIIRLKKTINGVSTDFGDAFKKLAPVPTLRKPDPAAEPSTRYLQLNQVILNWYPKIQAMKAVGVAGGDGEGQLNQAVLSASHIAFLDLDALFFEMQQFKADRAWHNLNLTREAIEELLADQTWYRLLIPQAELAFDSFEKVRLWQEIAESLLKKYCERYYSFRKKEWELPHLEYRDLDESDPNFPQGDDLYPSGYYRMLIEESQTEIIDKLKDLKAIIETGALREWEFGGLKAIWFGQHLYEPLLHLSGSTVEISPAPLNLGERTFVEDMRTFFDKKDALLKGAELYLLRNLSRGRGVGFFEAGNFHPDFIVWVIKDARQRIAFVDPKGIRNLGLTDPKISFHETIKTIEQRLADPSVVLSSFIISNTPSHQMRLIWGVEKSEMLARNILFQQEDQPNYVKDLIRRTLQ